jgi:hypothetical protein
MAFPLAIELEDCSLGGRTFIADGPKAALALMLSPGEAELLGAEVAIGLADIGLELGYRKCLH